MATALEHCYFFKQSLLDIFYVSWVLYLVVVYVLLLRGVDHCGEAFVFLSYLFSFRVMCILNVFETSY